jgi:predicted RNase H-like HicB family nuclease
MRILHVQVEQDDGWLIAQALEEPGVITQGRSFDELLANIRDAAALLLGEKAILIELIVPAMITVGGKKKVRKGRRRAA